MNSTQKFSLLRSFFVSALLLSLPAAQIFSQGQQQQAGPETGPTAQEQPAETAETRDSNQRPTVAVVLVDKVLNNFENAEDWRAFATSPLGITKSQKRIQRGSIEDTYNPQNLTDEERSLFIPGENHILGVKGFFKDRGFDRIEVKPPHSYIIRGIGRQVSVWALGRNFRHTLYIKLKDYRGKIYKIKMGRLNYFGWRKLTVTIPGWVRQSARFSLLDKHLKVVSLYVESDKLEVGGQFYFYLDQLTMKIDRTAQNYPGSQIKDLW